MIGVKILLEYTNIIIPKYFSTVKKKTDIYSIIYNF